MKHLADLGLCSLVSPL